VSDETFEIEAEGVKAETDKALLVRLETGDEVWVPKSVIHDDSEVFDTENAAGTLVVASWWAKNRGLL
jgi:hypothetical protein